MPPLHELDPDMQQLALDVWRDAENIAEDLEMWRALFDVPDGAFFTDDDPDDDTDDDSPTGHPSTHQWFEDLPDPVRAYRGGISGDWSWTTDRLLAAKFAEHGVQRGIEHTNFGVRTALIPKAQVFGALTGRGENELLVRCTPDRASEASGGAACSRLQPGGSERPVPMSQQRDGKVGRA